MTIKALNPFAPVWFTPAGQEKDDKKTRFQLTGLNGIQQAELQPEMTVRDDGVNLDITPRGQALLLRYGLIGWENFDNNEGPITFSFPDANQRQMPIALQTELGNEIFELTFLPQETKKK